jgi:3-dehydroquinate synthase
MDFLRQVFDIRFQYNVYFTTNLFDEKNNVFRSFLHEGKRGGSVKKILFVLDNGVVQHHPTLVQQIKNYFSSESDMRLVEEVIILPGNQEQP